MRAGETDGDPSDAATQVGDATLLRSEGGPQGASAPATVRAAPALRRGQAIGRYVVLAHLGAGGMGVVYAAYDPELDRKVALKLLAGGPGDTTVATAAGKRMLREAQALAQLAHPNVVGVHDVGTHGEQVWLAMEFVEGETVGDWLAGRPRGWREVLEVFTAIAAGLCAAHRAGLMHRDVKPDNAMIGSDGRVRVMDFGLARAEQARPEAALEAVTGGDSQAAWSLTLTRTGSLLGTPAYMAPEQWHGVATDARTDQFAFCVALWEALYGERPFAGTTAVELAGAVTIGKRRPPPAGRRAPSWLRRVVERGLAVDPNARWPTMDALLAALARGATRRRRLAVVGSLLALVLVGVGVLAGRGWQRAAREATCVAEGEQLGSLWSDDTRTRLTTALLATGVDYAGTTAASASAGIDRYVGTWADSRTAGCRHYLVEQAWDRDTAIKSHECLQVARGSLVALLGVLSAADAGAVERAVTAVGELPDPAACIDPVALAHRTPLPQAPTQRAEAELLTRALIEAAARGGAGAQAREALARVRTLQDRADELAWPPLQARARTTAGLLAGQDGQPKLAESLLADGLARALQAGEDAVAAEATALTYVIGYQLVDLPEASRWAELGRGLLARVGQIDTLREAQLELNWAAAGAESSDFDAAQRHGERALALRERILGAGHPAVASVVLRLGGLAHRRGDLANAEALVRRALDDLERALGPGHPSVATALANLSHVQRDQGDVAAAVRSLERALAIETAALGPEHLNVAYTLQNLAFRQLDRGDSEAAARLLDRVLAIYRRTLDPDHADIGSVMLGLGAISLERGDLEAALRSYRRVLAIRVKQFGPGNLETAMAQQFTAAALIELGRFDEAERLLAAAEQTVVAEGGPKHQLIGQLWQYRARLAARRGDHVTARQLAERALAVDIENFGADTVPVTASMLALADADLQLGRTGEAGPRYARTLEILEREVGSTSIYAGWCRLGLGEVALREGRAAEAVQSLERAITALTIAGPRSLVLADANFALARALYAAGGDRGRARGLADAALSSYRAAGEARRRELAAVITWQKRP